MNEIGDNAQAAAAAAAAASAAMNWRQTRAIVRIVFVILLVLVGLWIIYKLESVILLAILSIFFAYLISPLVELISRPLHISGKRIGVPRAVAIGIVYLLIVGSFTIVLYIALPRIWAQTTSFFQQAPAYLSSAQNRAQGMNGLYDRLQLPQGARDAVNGFLRDSVTDISKYTGEEGLQAAATKIQALVGYLPKFILIPILAFFFLRDVDNFRRSALRMLPRGRWRWRGDEFFQDVNSTLAAYIRAQLSACVIVGVICSIGFVIIGVPYWLALGVFAGFLEFIPLVGPLVIALFAIFLAAFHSWSSALAVLAFLAVLRIVEDYVIYPRLIGQGIHLHPLAVILAILCGAELAGVAGIFLAIPVIAIATVSYRHWMEHRGSDGLVADILDPHDPTVQVPQPAQTVPEFVKPRDRRSDVTISPEDMVRARPDLTTGELQLPRSD